MNILPARSPAAAKPTVVSVNGAVIPQSAIVREIQYHPAGSPAESWRLAAEALVLPGDGAFGATMDEIRSRGLLRPLLDAVASGTPLLGICIGMQVLFEESEEHGRHAGLGLLPGRVRRIPGPLPVPHMGWNRVRRRREHPLLEGIEAPLSMIRADAEARAIGSSKPGDAVVDGRWALRYLEAKRNIPVRLAMLDDVARRQGRLGMVDAEVVAMEAMIGSPREVRNALSYVLLNARRHGLGRAAQAGENGRVAIDPASSGRWFDGWRGLPDLATPDQMRAEPAVAPPRTWLVRVGWRKHGLIDPLEIPAQA